MLSTAEIRAIAAAVRPVIAAEIAEEVHRMPPYLGDEGWSDLERRATDAGYPGEAVREIRQADDFATQTVEGGYQYGYRCAAQVVLTASDPLLRARSVADLSRPTKSADPDHTEASESGIRVHKQWRSISWEIWQAGYARAMPADVRSALEVHHNGHTVSILVSLIGIHEVHCDTCDCEIWKPEGRDR
jgi:hypothetical protein